MNRWIIGVDVGTRSRGALHFSRWLAEAAGARWDEVFVPVHVLDQEHLRTALRYRHLDEVEAEERTEVARQIAETVPDVAGVPQIVRALTVEDGLEEARARHRAEGVIVARTAPREGRHVFRLGGVVRGMLSGLASPVVVAPPDLTAGTVGAGPVVALTSLAPDAIAACRLAHALAEAARRELTLVHVAAERQDAGEAPGAGGGAELDAALARWGSDHGVWPDLSVVVDGELPEAALAYAEARGAALVAVGAHPAAGLRGAVEPKVWRWLAAHARHPVLVVPSGAARAARRIGGRADEGLPAGPGNAT